VHRRHPVRQLVRCTLDPLASCLGSIKTRMAYEGGGFMGSRGTLDGFDLASGYFFGVDGVQGHAAR
jgi:hypothetical protein